MAKPEWGTKRTCQNCGARFYDLMREPIVCPLCQSTLDPERQPRSRRTGAAARPEPAVARKKLAEGAHETIDTDEIEEEAGAVDLEETEEADEAGEMEDIDSDNEELIEDASELGQDDDDIGEVIEHLDDDIEDKT